MIEALHISESGLRATQDWINHISNNVANMQTAGYKKSSVQFENLISSSNINSSSINSGSNGGGASQSGIGTRLMLPTTDFASGPVKSTSRSLDLAIQGKGFFEVMLDDGELAYTRLGNLHTNVDGYLATAGDKVLSDQIQIPPEIEQIIIEENGTVIGKYLGESGSVELGQIHLAQISNAESMRALGEGLFQVNDKTSEATVGFAGENGTGVLLQGFLEMSNVELVDEMTSLVLAQRSYQLNARIIQTADQVLETINNLRR